MVTDVNPTDDPREFEAFQLSEYLDGQLDDASRVALEERLQAEPELKARLDELRRVDALVRDMGERAPASDPESFVEQVRRRRMAIGRPGRTSLLFRLAVPMAAAAVIVLALTVFRPVPSGPGAPVDSIAVVAVGPAIDGSVSDPDRPAPVIQVSFSPGRAATPVSRQATLLVATAGSFVPGPAIGVVEEEMPVF